MAAIQRRFQLLLISLFSPISGSHLIYRQSIKYISSEFIEKLICGIEEFAPLSSSEITNLRACSALHLRLGDRGSTLNEMETISLKSILNNFDSTDSVLVFTDNVNAARILLSQIVNPSITNFADYSDDLTTLHALSLCKARFCIRSSTFFDWSDIISRYI